MKQSASKRGWKCTIEEGVAFIKSETLAVMTDLGIEQNNQSSWKDLPRMIRQFSAHNRNPILFLRNLDGATYEIREKLRWNTRMASKLALQKVRDRAPWSHNSIE